MERLEVDDMREVPPVDAAEQANSQDRAWIKAPLSRTKLGKEDGKV